MRAEIILENSYGFVVNLVLNVGVGLPGADGDESEGDAVEDGDSSQVEADDVVVLGAVQPADPVAGEIKPGETNRGEDADDQCSEEPVRQVVEPMEIQGCTSFGPRTK